MFLGYFGTFGMVKKMPHPGDQVGGWVHVPLTVDRCQGKITLSQSPSPCLMGRWRGGGGARTLQKMVGV